MVDIEGRLLKTRDGGYLAQVMDADGRMLDERRFAFSQRSQAEQWARDRAVEIAKGVLVNALHDDLVRAVRGRSNMSVRRTSRGPEITLRI